MITGMVLGFWLCFMPSEHVEDRRGERYWQPRTVAEAIEMGRRSAPTVIFGSPYTTSELAAKLGVHDIR